MKRAQWNLVVAAVLLWCLFFGNEASWAKGNEKKMTSEEASVAREIKIGERIAEQIAKNMELVQDPRVLSRVRMVFDKLTPSLKRPLPYSVQIVRDDSVNAFCIPGGFIYVTTGLLDFVHCEAELASVLSHELIHSTGKHGIIQVERNQKLSLAALAIAIASRGEGAAVILSSLAQVAISSSYSRDLEQEADQEGLKLLTGAGYPAVAALTVLEGLAAEELTMPWYDPGIYLDHPKIQERINYTREQILKMGYPIHRKQVLGLLRSSVASGEGGLQLKVDDVEILTLPAGEENQRLLDEVAAKLDRSFQMELSPYDIRIIKTPEGEQSLYIGLTEILKSLLPEGAVDLEEIRSKLLTAHGNALKKHPIADYLG